MRDTLLDTLFFTLMVLFIGAAIYSGVYFDLDSVVSYVTAFLLSPILAYVSLHFVKEFVFDYLNTSKKFTRSMILKRVDPLLI